jgi:hypothetical protein
MFLPGTTSAGHYQIEVSCQSCHTPFTGVTNDACLACHGVALAAADDSHPMSKFTDPRNADLVARLDATRCVTCHREHTPETTGPMGVTLPADYCWMCHRDVGRDRPSHQGLAFDGCAAAGCHNYHDNTALYEDFLSAHAREPALQPVRQVRVRSVRERMRTAGVAVPRIESLASDAPPAVGADPNQVAAWETAVHARAGVNCLGCHAAADGAARGRWMDRPGERECAVCHDSEVEGFFGGRHGMRVAAGLPRMTPRMARRSMRAEAHDRELSCASCHGAHDFDTRRAAVEACLACHDDRHSTAFAGSPHHELWTKEQQGTAPAGTGVSCATCHLPRERRRTVGIDAVLVQHNQNANLRPNEKMTRTVCLDCHGLQFSLDALADRALVDGNFRGSPSRSVAGIDMATRRTAGTAK